MKARFIKETLNEMVIPLDLSEETIKIEEIIKGQGLQTGQFYVEPYEDKNAVKIYFNNQNELLNKDSGKKRASILEIMKVDKALRNTQFRYKTFVEDLEDEGPSTVIKIQFYPNN